MRTVALQKQHSDASAGIPPGRFFLTTTWDQRVFSTFNPCVLLRLACACFPNAVRKFVDALCQAEQLPGRFCFVTGKNRKFATT